jgi:hypothetical protein
MKRLPDHLALLERELRNVFGTRLSSLLAYGLDGAHAPHPGHTHHATHATHRVLETATIAIVESLTPRDLLACTELVAGWHEAGLATPILLTAAEIKASLDAFPLEFSFIQANHVVAFGPDPFETVVIDVADVRRACEVQARSHLLHLREGFLETRGNADALALLIVRSAAPFAALLTSIARLQRATASDHAAAARHVERTLDLPAGSASEIVALAHVTEIAATDARQLFAPYLAAVEKLVGYVDGWSA